MDDISNSLTIIITASFIPSHPSLSIIKQTIDSLHLINYPSDTKIILAHDYCNNVNYNLYFKELNHYVKAFPNIMIVTRETHGHLVGNIRNALHYVTTKYILVIQHDLPFVRSFDIQKVISDMEENPSIKYVRFNKRNNIKSGFDALNDLFGLQQEQTNYTYTRTPAWSDNNHICTTSYYNTIVMKECSDGYPMEICLHGKNVNLETHNIYGTYLFGPLDYPQTIYHTDGRNTKIL